MGKGKKGRRRITRRSSNQRSNTTPDLIREPFIVAGDVGSAVSESRTDGEGISSLPSPFEPFPAITDSVAYRHSPAASIGSGSSTSTDDKKKHNLLSFRFKDNDRPKSSPASPHSVSSPLPPDTPGKALEMLGFDFDRTRTRSRSLGSQDQDDDEFDDLLVTSTLKQQASSSSLTTSKVWPVKDTKPKEQDVGTDTNKAEGFWEASTKKVQRMLGLQSTHATNIKHEADSERSRIELPTLHLREENEDYQISGSDFQACLPLQTPATRPIAETPRRRKRKKAPKSLDRMPPITETSHDELHNSYNDCEHNTELELISEYEHDVSYFSGLKPPSRTSSLRQPKVWYRLNQEDLSPSETGSEENNGTGRKEPAVKSADEHDWKRLDHRPLAAVQPRSPLQTMEDRFLDATEVNLAASKVKQYMKDVSRGLIDLEVSSLRESHRRMKEESRAIRPDLLPEKSNNNGSKEENQDDAVSIRSSIDLEEESVICETKVMAFTRVTPGMVKLVDIPPKRLAHAMPSGHRLSLASSSEARPTLTPKYCFKNDENPAPFKGCTRDVEPTIMPSHLALQKHNCVHHINKVNIPRKTSRILAQDWTSTYENAKQRPLPGHPDVDVLTDPQIPPAPLIKQHPPLPTHPPPPPRMSSKEHYCIKNGHILHPINLKTIPDEAAINGLQVRPYLCTPAGRKEHVRVPVFCNRCGEDVKEELWECDVAVCHLVCCRKCAMDMEREWKDRVTDA